MVTSSGGVKLLDFGVARARFDSRESHTGQLVLGTLNYMAPEYIVTGEVSPAADVYGLGLSLWQVAAGEVYGQPKVRQDAPRAPPGQAPVRAAGRVCAAAARAAPHDGLGSGAAAHRPGGREPAAGCRRRHDGHQLAGLGPAHHPDVLAARAPAPDKAGLVGQSFPVGPADAPEDPVPVRDIAPIEDPAWQRPVAAPDSTIGGVPSPLSPAAPRVPPAPLRDRSSSTGDESRATGQDGRAGGLPSRSPSAPPASTPLPAPWDSSARRELPGCGPAHQRGRRPPRRSSLPTAPPPCPHSQTCPLAPRDRAQGPRPGRPLRNAPRLRNRLAAHPLSPPLPPSPVSLP